MYESFKFRKICGVDEAKRTTGDKIPICINSKKVITFQNKQCTLNLAHEPSHYIISLEARMRWRRSSLTATRLARSFSFPLLRNRTTPASPASFNSSIVMSDILFDDILVARLVIETSDMDDSSFVGIPPDARHQSRYGSCTHNLTIARLTKF